MTCSERQITVQWKEHGEILANGLWNFLKDDYMVDTNVTFQEDCIKVHRIILAIFLPTFRQYVNDFTVPGFQELNMNYVASCGEDVKALVELVYRGAATLPAAQIGRLGEMAENLGMESLAVALNEHCGKPAAKSMWHEQDSFDGACDAAQLVMCELSQYRTSDHTFSVNCVKMEPLDDPCFQEMEVTQDDDQLSSGAGLSDKADSVRKPMPLLCPKCLMSFATMEEIKFHRKTCHGMDIKYKYSRTATEAAPVEAKNVGDRRRSLRQKSMRDLQQEEEEEALASCQTSKAITTEDSDRVWTKRKRRNKVRIYRRCSGERLPHRCDLCDSAYRKRHTLDKHRRLHEFATYECHICGHPCQNKEYVDVHLTWIHEFRPDQLIACAHKYDVTKETWNK